MLSASGEPTGKKWTKWKNDAKKEAAAAVRAYRKDGTYKVRESLYARCGREIAKHFYGKCGYCESRVVDASVRNPDVEHHRPKGRVRNRQSREIVRDAMGREHPGYFWLAYYWKNLLPSCPGCNRPGNDGKSPTSVGKWDFFPTAKPPAAPPDDQAVDIEEHHRLLDQLEEPLLLNPWTVRNPEEHLVFDFKTGVIGSITDVGRETIDLLDLNRDGLIAERQQAILATRGALAAVMLNVAAGQPEWEAVKEALGHPSQTYAAFRRAVLRTFEKG
jgi:hypothetical protein